MKTYYVTKYALTKGIIEVSGEVLSGDGNGGYLYLRAVWPGAPNGVARFYAPDWHERLDEAQARADQMVERRISSLNRQIEKLKSEPFKFYKKS